MAKRWTFYPAHSNLSALAESLKVGPLLAQVLANRGLAAPEACRAFLDCSYEQLHRPETMPGLMRAAERIVQAVKKGEKTAIYGDYDVDGLTAAAILYQCLKLAGLGTTLYVPHRIEEGYGLNCVALEQLARDGHTLIVSVDCGVTSLAEAARARELGVDLIITDHHEPERELPAAYAVVDPKLPDSQYPFRDLAGVGVAFKLAWAIGLILAGEKNCSKDFQRFLTDAISLAALGTIADVVPLVGENRVLAAMGLKALSHKRTHPGLEAIVESASLYAKDVKERDVAFIIAPRLNAAGRMGHAGQALRLLTEATAEEARQIASELEQENQRRQQVERDILEQAVEIVERRGDASRRHTLVVASRGWHAGVIGIVAARLVERYHRPTILIALEDDSGQGSGRSIAAFNLFQALDSCAHLMTSFGGHAMAAGLRLAADKVEPLAEAVEAHARKVLQAADLIPSLQIDAETTLAALSPKAVKELSLLSPFGQGNPRPLFAASGCRLAAPPARLGKDGSHLALMLQQVGCTLRGVYWWGGDELDTLAAAETLDVAFRPQINAFRGFQAVELEIKDVHPGGYREPA